MQSFLTDPLEILTDALKDERPLVLFAGQSLDAAHDAILEAFLNRSEGADRDLGWRAAIERGITPADMTWLSERFDRSVPSDAAASIFELAWSAVFTSSIDPRFARRFEIRGRQPEPILSKDTYARAPRSRSRPPVYYLLGKSNETVEDARAPGTRNDLRRRLSQHAISLLNRIAETATVRGLLIMAGYDADKDWIALDSLLTPLPGEAGQAGPKVLWFGYRGTGEGAAAETADEMIQKGTLITTPTTLADAIEQLKRQEVLDVKESAAPDDPGLVSITGAALDITPALRLRVEASASIVDDGWTQGPDPLGESEEYEAFRRFHSTPSNFRLLVEGVSRKFAVERQFEQILWKKVKTKLTRIGQPDSDDVVILHGQSGTGKSIALARLALKIRLNMHLPVLAATNRLPNYTDIEAFCMESERLGATATVLICDASQHPSRYDELASALRSLGRRVLIVGTCYRIENRAGPRSNRLVEAPTHVSEAELNALKPLQKKFDLPSHHGSSTTDSIFAMLYRSLPAARERLAAGVSSEARAAEARVRERARQVPPSTLSRITDIMELLIKWGNVSPTSKVFEEDEKLAALGLDAAGRLIDYVMAAGRLNCPVPVNLVFRVLGQDSGLYQDQVVYLLSDLDLFRWRNDEEGSDYLISPRIQLEAKLICQRRLTLDQEIERLLDLIDNIRFGTDQHAERSFLLDLSFKIDRNGPRQEAYRRGYLRFADALKQLRERNRIIDPDLVLRECVFRRRAVFKSQSDGDEEGTSEQRLAILDAARDTVEKTLHQIDEGRNISVSRKTKQSLIAERSAIYGYLAVQHAQLKEKQDFWSDYLAARTANEKAIGLARNAYPIDIALWTAKDVLRLKKDDLSDAQQAELLADLSATIDVADDVFQVKQQSIRIPNDSHKDNDPDEGLIALDQKAKYLERRSQVASVMGNTELDHQTLTQLESIAPAAATFLVAKRRAERIYASEPPFDDDERRIAEQAANYISSRAAAGIALDNRCQRLLLRLRWAQATGERLMFDQRGRTPVDKDQILDLNTIVATLNEQAGTDARYRERFLEAVLCWLLRDTRRADDVWRSLAHDTESEDRSRVVRWLMETDESGAPRRFRGRVEAQGKGQEAWWVRVEGIDSLIRMSARDFRNEDLAPGRELRGFGIAFNYIGPSADPLSSRPVRRR